MAAVVGAVVVAEAAGAVVLAALVVVASAEVAQAAAGKAGQVETDILRNEFELHYPSIS